ncbi:MAG: uroporphyrinogen-III C-methyltransferase [Aquimonas sp.]|nr:uroporphyrinogen-III C-methyltransferase [Aquimonas sp.]
MSQTDSLSESDTAPADASSVATTRQATRRGGLGWILVLAVLVAALLTGYYLWTELQRARGEAQAGRDWQTEVQALDARLEALSRRHEQVAVSQRQLDARVGEVASNQRVIRQELLGMGERAATIEEAVGRVSEQRLRGETLLKLNELEGLLLVSEQRLLLAGDVEGAHLALALAASVLQTLDDPLYAGLALPLAAEREALQRVGEDPIGAAQRTLQDALTASAGLPLRRPAVAEAEAPAVDTSERLQQALSRLVTVRRQGAADAAVGSAEAAALRHALALDLRTALGAVERRDAEGLRAAVDRMLPTFDRLFEPQADAVQAWRARLAGLADAPLRRPLPVLGQTLAELRALRGHRQRMQPEPQASAVAAPPRDSQPVDEQPAAPDDVEPTDIESEADGEPLLEADDRRAPPTVPVPRV